MRVCACVRVSFWSVACLGRAAAEGLPHEFRRRRAPPAISCDPTIHPNRCFGDSKPAVCRVCCNRRKSGKTPPKTLLPTKTRFEPQRLEGRLKSLLFSQLYQFAVVMGVLSVAAQTLCECSWVCVWKNRVFATCPSTNFVRVDVGVCVGVCVCVCVSFCACMCFCLLGK